jgi:hypothetical protein
MIPLAFKRVLDEAADLVDRKNEGYAGVDPVDPWSNYRGAEAWGLTALDSALLRFDEKRNRAAVLYGGFGLDRVGEPLRETLLDAANILLIAVCLIDEQEGAQAPTSGVKSDSTAPAGVRRIAT